VRIGVDARCLEWGRGGVARYLINMLKIWPNISSEHKFILYFQNFIPDDSFLKNPFFELRLLKGPSFLRSHRILAEQILMPLQIKKDMLDIFFATWYSAPLSIGKIKTVVAAWDISYSTNPDHYNWIHRISLGFFSRKACLKSNGVITCSKFDAEQIAKYYLVPLNKICTVALAADKRFNTSLDMTKIRDVNKKYNLPSNFILSMGVIHNRRNVDVIIKSFNLLKDDYKTFSLVVVGRNSTNPKIDIEGLMKDLIKEKRAVYIPWIDDNDLPSIYHASRFYICTSTVDGETLMLKEAMQSGTPVITSRLLKDTIGGNGLIINNPENISSTSKTLKIAMDMTHERKRLIKDGVIWTKRITWDRVAKKSLAFLESR